ncbi:hypothetical protein M8J76_014503 [Diaphorina citri]|nr:hypothetical protein M8J76_014503 [Diaphorina citri]
MGGAYENRLLRLQDTVSHLHAENQALKRQIRSLEVTGFEQVQTALLERLESLEIENCNLRQESDTQRRKYEKCLDDVANQVVRAILSQKGLREEIASLRRKLRDTECANIALSGLLVPDSSRTVLHLGHLHLVPPAPSITGDSTVKALPPEGEDEVSGESSVLRDEGYSTMSSDMQGTQETPRRGLEDLVETQETNQGETPLHSDSTSVLSSSQDKRYLKNLDSDIYFSVSLLLNARHALYNPRHSFPPPSLSHSPYPPSLSHSPFNPSLSHSGHVMPYQSMLRSLSDSHLSLNLPTTLHTSVMMSDKWTSSVATEEDIESWVSGDWWDADYIQHWLRLDEVRWPGALHYDTSELEDWTMREDETCLSPCRSDRLLISPSTYDSWSSSSDNCSESLANSTTLGVDFTRDFYRLVKFESTKSLSSTCSTSVSNKEETCTATCNASGDTQSLPDDITTRKRTSSVEHGPNPSAHVKILRLEEITSVGVSTSSGCTKSLPHPSEVATSSGSTKSLPHPTTSEVATSSGSTKSLPHPTTSEVATSSGSTKSLPHPSEVSTSSDERPENKSRTSRFKEGHFVPYTEVKEIHPNSENEGKERISCPNHTKSHRNELKDQYPHSQNEKESYFNQSESKEILSHIESEDGIVKDKESKNRLPNHSDFGSQKRNDPSLTQSQKRSESKIPLKDPKFQKRNDPKSQNGNEGFSSQKRIDPKSLNEPSKFQSQSHCESNVAKNQNEFNTSQNHLSTQNRTEPTQNRSKLTQNRTESTQNRTESSQNRCEPIALYENLLSGGVIPQYESNNVDQLYGNVTWGDEPYATDKSDRDGLERSDGFWSDLDSRKSHWNGSNSRNGEFNSRNGEFTSRNHQSSELDSKSRSYSALEMETDSKGRYWSELDSRNGALNSINSQWSEPDSRNLQSGELNSRNRSYSELNSKNSHWTNTDSRNCGIDSRNGEFDSRNGGIDSKNGEFDSRNGELDSRNGEIDSRNGEFDSKNRPWSESNFKELEKRNFNGIYWNNLDNNGDCRDVLSSEMENRDRLWSDKDKDTSKDSLWNEMEDRGRYWSDKDGDREEEEGEIECLQEDFSYELSSRGMSRNGLRTELNTVIEENEDEDLSLPPNLTSPLNQSNSNTVVNITSKKPDSPVNTSDRTSNSPVNYENIRHTKQSQADTPVNYENIRPAPKQGQADTSVKFSDSNKPFKLQENSPVKISDTCSHHLGENYTPVSSNENRHSWTRDENSPVNTDRTVFQANSSIKHGDLKSNSSVNGDRTLFQANSSFKHGDFQSNSSVNSDRTLFNPNNSSVKNGDKRPPTAQSSNTPVNTGDRLFSADSPVNFGDSRTSKQVIDELNRMIQSDEMHTGSCCHSPCSQYSGSCSRQGCSSYTGSEEDGSCCNTGWIHVERHIDLADPKARANLLDVMLASSRSSSSSEEEGGEGEDVLDYYHLHALHRFRRQKKAAIREPLGALRFSSSPRPSILGRDDFYVRYGEKEREAVASFDFLESLSTASSRDETESEKVTEL